MSVRVEVTGDFLVESSLARVNRGLFGALARNPEIDLSILAEPTAARISGSSDDALLEDARWKRFLPDPDVSVRHRWPAVFPRVRAGAYVHMQPWEFGSLPALWANEMREVADEAWCYSNYVAEMYRRAGIPAERVRVVPLGFDPAFFAPGPAPQSAGLRDRCVFLYVGDTIARKGIDVVVNAYISSFQRNDPVVLIVKDFGTKAPGDDTRLRDQVRELASRRDIAPILYVDTVYTDSALADLYRAATVLVAPYRGEGFGLPVLEAMACGLAPIVTAGGATDDFTTGETAIRIDASRIALGKTYAGFDLVDDAFLLEPVESQVAAAMRRVYERPEEAREMGKRAAGYVREGWTWAHAAERAAERLVALAGIEPLAARRKPAPQLQSFELSIASPGGEDGVLLELFRRIGTPDPCYVEFADAGADAAISVFLARSLGWRGSVLQGDSAAYASVAERLASTGMPEEFDLLVLGTGGDPAWARLGEYKPKVIVTRDGAPEPLARSHGYAYLGSTSAQTSAFFVRDDVLPRTRL
jgi:glycosyltransferase involved in cell wall biosynthesis